MEMEKFYQKNDIGVSIEYTIIGRYEEDGINYIIYTDFVEDSNSLSGIRLFVAKDNKEKVDDLKQKEIINNMYESFISNIDNL